MLSKSIFFMAALTLIILLAALYLGYELTETRKKNQVLIQQLLKSENNVGTGEGQESFLKGAVKNTIVKNSQSIQGCYLSLIESTPDILESGKVLIDWQIDPRGKVFEVGVVRDEFSNKEFQACLREKIGEIIFPAPPSVRPVYVDHTFLFRKEENK